MPKLLSRIWFRCRVGLGTFQMIVYGNVLGVIENVMNAAVPDYDSQVRKPRKRHLLVRFF